MASVVRAGRAKTHGGSESVRGSMSADCLRSARCTTLPDMEPQRSPSERTTRFVLAALLSLALLGTLGAQTAPWCAITVSTSDGLRDALETMPPGSVICLRPSVYEAGLAVRQSVVLRGVGRPEQVVLEGAGEPDEPVIDFYANPSAPYVAILENVTVRGAVGGSGDVEGRSDHGLFIDRDVHVLLRDVICSDNEGAGVLVVEGGSLMARGCAFSDNLHGVAVVDRSSARFDDCEFIDNGVGLALAQDGQVMLDACLISGNADVGALLLSGQATLEDCEISDNGWGCLLGSPSNPPLLLRMAYCDVIRNREVGIAWLTAECYDPSVPDGAEVLISGKRNEIPRPDEPDGNAGGGLCPEYPGAPWPKDFVKD